MAEVPKRIEQSGLPTALLWHPLLGSDFEDRLVSFIPFTVRLLTRSERRRRGFSRRVCSCRRFPWNRPSPGALLGKT